jgi:hypothetical protein
VLTCGGTVPTSDGRELRFPVFPAPPGTGLARAGVVRGHSREQARPKYLYQSIDVISDQ